MWSNELTKVTRDVISEHRFVPYGDIVHFKNCDLRFGFISVSNILADKLILIDRKTNEEILYTSVDGLIDDGWVVD